MIIKKNNLFRITLINILIFIGLGTSVSAFFLLLESRHKSNQPISDSLTSNTIRSTYPGYLDELPGYALNIFNDFKSLNKEYYPFVGYRNDPYIGLTTSVDSFGFRKSFNHAINNSTWFFGGSTTWGTGSDDQRTIPSLYAKLTGEKVLNAGESGYYSFQELIQLQILLSRGHRPNKVVFYDGNNDARIYFMLNEINPTHGASSRLKALRKKNKKLSNENKLLRRNKINFINDIRESLVLFYLTPYRYLQTSKVEEINSKKYSNKYNFDNFPLKPHPSKCSNTDYVKKSVIAKIDHWKMANDILKRHSIKPKFFLQPFLGYKYNLKNANYIIDRIKQRTLVRLPYFSLYYSTLISEWEKRCIKDQTIDCDQLIDLSGIFQEVNDPIYIDNVHLTPLGNSFIAKEIAKIMNLK